jgi:hypothetical protein
METRPIVVSFRVTPEERAAISAVARRLKRTDSDVTRLAILGLAEQLTRGRRTAQGAQWEAEHARQEA